MQKCVKFRQIFFRQKNSAGQSGSRFQFGKLFPEQSESAVSQFRFKLRRQTELCAENQTAAVEKLLQFFHRIMIGILNGGDVFAAAVDSDYGDSADGFFEDAGGTAVTDDAVCITVIQFIFAVFRSDRVSCQETDNKILL